MTALWNRDRKPRLLVIENDFGVGNMLRIYFDQWAEVTLVSRASEGLELYSSALFDLIILGVGFTDSGEDEFMRSIQAPGKKVPIIVVSSRNERAARLKGLELGADDYIPKPFDIEELRFRVSRILKHLA